MLTNSYFTILAIHGWLRWLILLAGAGAVIVSVAGLRARSSFRPLGRRASLAYVVAIDVQFLLGVILYGISPIVRVALANMAVAMREHELRFFAVEHIATMLLALILAHIGAVRARRAIEDRGKYLQTLIWYSASLMMILAGMPWWRPLLRPL